MKRNNLKLANEICKECDRLQSHLFEMQDLDLDGLPEYQRQAAESYINALSKKIKALEKEISSL